MIFKGHKLTIGLDLGDRWSCYCVLDEAGEILLEQKVATTPEAMKQTFERIPRSLIALETGTHSPWVSRLLKELGHEVLVAHAQKVQLITKSKRKDDRHDARTLARLARIDPELLGPVRHRSAKAQIHLTVIRARAELVGARTALVNAARGLVKSYGQRLPKCGTQQVSRELGAGLPAELHEVLEPLIQHKSTGLSCHAVAAFPYLVTDTGWTLAIRRKSCAYGEAQFSHSISRRACCNDCASARPELASRVSVNSRTNAGMTTRSRKSLRAGPRGRASRNWSNCKGEMRCAMHELAGFCLTHRDSCGPVGSYRESQCSGFGGKEIRNCGRIYAWNPSLRKRRNGSTAVALIPFCPGALVENPRCGVIQRGFEFVVTEVLPEDLNVLIRGVGHGIGQKAYWEF
jgi:hypothetical protein